MLLKTIKNGIRFILGWKNLKVSQESNYRLKYNSLKEEYYDLNYIKKLYTKLKKKYFYDCPEMPEVNKVHFYMDPDAGYTFAYTVFPDTKAVKFKDKDLSGYSLDIKKYKYDPFNYKIKREDFIKKKLDIDSLDTMNPFLKLKIKNEDNKIKPIEYTPSRLTFKPLGSRFYKVYKNDRFTFDIIANNELVKNSYDLVINTTALYNKKLLANLLCHEMIHIMQCSVEKYRLAFLYEMDKDKNHGPTFINRMNKINRTNPWFGKISITYGDYSSGTLTYDKKIDRLVNDKMADKLSELDA